MSMHLERDLEGLHHDILHMCSIVEDMIHRAVDGLRSPSVQLAEELAVADDEIDTMDVQIENDCLKILALHQPVAIDLRRIATVLKITTCRQTRSLHFRQAAGYVSEVARNAASKHRLLRRT